MSTATKRLIWLGVAAAAVAALLLPRLAPSSRAPETPAAAGPEALAVETRLLAPGPIEERLATTGTILADEEVVIRSEIAGILEEVRFREGVRVGAGQLLVRLDDAQLAAERDRARHRLELARLSETREKDLLAQGLLSQDDYDRTLSQLRVLEAELRLAEAQLEKTEIRAPFAGRIGLRRISPGAAISPDTRITTLQALDTVKVEFTFPERYAALVRLGETIRFRVKGSEGSFAGTIYAIEPAVDRETRSLTARARSSNPAGRLLPGAFADVELAVREIDDALTVPAIAVIPELGGKKVFVVEDGRAQPRIVETGIRTETEVQIVRGLAAGDEVIVSGIQRLATGRPVAARRVAERAETEP